MLTSCSIVTLTSFGIAKPIPSTWSAAIFIELIPTKLPLTSTNAPPELPGLIAASVCSTFTLVPPEVVLDSIVRSFAEIIPDVTELANSKVGYPLRKHYRQFEL